MAETLNRHLRRPRRASDLESRIASGTADPVSEDQRARAARIRVSYDEKRGVITEEWIKKLSKQ